MIQTKYWISYTFKDKHGSGMGSCGLAVNGDLVIDDLAKSLKEEMGYKGVAIMGFQKLQRNEYFKSDENSNLKMDGLRLELERIFFDLPNAKQTDDLTAMVWQGNPHPTIDEIIELFHTWRAK